MGRVVTQGYGQNFKLECPQLAPNGRSTTLFVGKQSQSVELEAGTYRNVRQRLPRMD